MSDFIQFNEGSTYIAQHGWPTTVWFLLVRSPVSSYNQQDTLAGVDEISGTGYGRMAQTLPTIVDGVISFNAMTWTTGINTDWPPSVHAIAAATTSNNSGVCLCMWNLQTNGQPRNLSGTFTFEEVTPTYVS